MISYFPKYFTNRAIGLYIALLLTIPILFSYPMHWYWWLFGIIEVAGFFYFLHVLTKQWASVPSKKFEHNILVSALWIRIVYVIFSFLFYQGMTGTPFEFSAGDSMWYDWMGRYGADIIWGKGGSWSEFFKYAEVSDAGYPLYLSVLYAVSGKSILVSRIVKAVISSYTVLLVYRMARRTFGEESARITSVICILMPNLVYYCGLSLKETEMLFLTVLFIERADALFRRQSTRVWDIIELALIGVSTFFFRAVLCYVLFLTLVATVVLGSNRIKRGGKWAIEGMLLVILGLIGYTNIGTSLYDSTEYSNVQEQQVASMQWRAERKDGNSYAKYASASVFAPLIFTIPFPTMVNIETQQNQQMIHGGNFVKNITSFFTILALILLLLTGKWRDNILPVAFVCGYLLVLAFSSFAQSERFHIPSLPFELMLASYAITNFKSKHRNWFTFWLVLIFVANIAWAWFKLRGRGM